MSTHMSSHLSPMWNHGPDVMCKKLQFFWTFFEKSAENLGNSRFFINFPGKYGTLAGDMCAQKLTFFCKKLQFFQKKGLFPRKWAFLGYFPAHIWHICSQMDVHKNCNFFQFQGTFQYKLYYRWLFSWDICATWGCTKIDIFLQKIAIFLRITIELHCKVAQKWENSGRYAAECGCTKIAIFFNFWVKKALFPRKWALLTSNHGRYADI